MLGSFLTFVFETRNNPPFQTESSSFHSHWCSEWKRLGVSAVWRTGTRFSWLDREAPGSQEQGCETASRSFSFLHTFPLLGDSLEGNAILFSAIYAWWPRQLSGPVFMWPFLFLLHILSQSHYKSSLSSPFELSLSQSSEWVPSSSYKLFDPSPLAHCFRLLCLCFILVLSLDIVDHHYLIGMFPLMP